MKKIITLLILIFNICSYAQNDNNVISGIYTFPINTKFTIKLTPNTAGYFDYSVVKVENYDKVIGNWDDEKVFEDKGENETIEFCFCLEKDWNDNQKTNTMLLLKSRSKYSFKFKTEIQTEKDGEFKENFNLGAHARSITSDRWAKKTLKIRISRFEKK
ncbi:MAG: hypothetical protein V4572_08185 [Bacteroidota bacterium]